MAAVDYFLKIDGIDGESVDDKHAGAIEPLSFSWGLSQAASFATGGGAGAGKVQFQDFHFTSNTSKASPKLMLACASGVHIKKAELFCRKAGGEGAAVEFMKLSFEDVLISSYQNGGHGNESPTESISFAFAKVEFAFAPQRADGGLGAAVTAGWNVKANQKV